MDILKHNMRVATEQNFIIYMHAYIIGSYDTGLIKAI